MLRLVYLQRFVDSTMHERYNANLRHSAFVHVESGSVGWEVACCHTLPSAINSISITIPDLASCYIVMVAHNKCESYVWLC